MSPALVSTVAELRAQTDPVRARGGRVAFVPTMGALHEGHLSLMREARRRGALAVASIFVNPTQFGPAEDLARYPRDLPGDLAKAGAAGVDLVFAPAVEEMYPREERTRVVVSGLTEGLCGAFRPGHFDGVTTIVCKLFAAIGPCVAVFGRKDYQQLKVIERMVRDLLLPVEVVGMPIVREPDGLAMSSRNAYLSAEQRARALCLSQGLRAARARFDAGARAAGDLLGAARPLIATAMDSIDYLTLADPETLVPVPEGADAGPRALLAVAARIGATRLLDNVVLGE